MGLMEIPIIRTDQIGYIRSGTKHAVIQHENIDFFTIRRTDNNAAVYKAELSKPYYSKHTDETVQTADFTAFKEDGNYYIAAGGLKSYPFTISDTPYNSLRLAVLEMFNCQKCGADVKYGLWSHPACHTNPATVYGTNTSIDVTGGWHDAGDYGRYIVPSAKAVADLLLAYELGKVKDNNLLETVKYAVEWFLKMQCKITGGVYHKVTAKNFCALDVMPNNESEPYILSPISKTATACFAAVTALSSRFYPQLKIALLNAANRAWLWCMDNPDMPGFTNPPDITTGEYPDPYPDDELFWAASELYKATNDEVYHEYIKTYQGALYTGLGWRALGTYGLIAYLFGEAAGRYAGLSLQMKEELTRACENIMKKYNESPYGDSLGGVYSWGGNMHVADNAVTLVLGAQINNKPEYIKAAGGHLNYLLGLNALGKSFITGFGANPPQNPHHRPSAAAGAPMPGMVVGGPDGSLNDPILKAATSRLPAAQRYLDHADSYASNEVTIYWNSPVYFLMALLGV